MKNNVECYTKDGTLRKPSETQVPDYICDLLHKTAENILKRNNEKAS